MKTLAEEAKAAAAARRRQRTSSVLNARRRQERARAQQKRREFADRPERERGRIGERWGKSEPEDIAPEHDWLAPPAEPPTPPGHPEPGSSLTTLTTPAASVRPARLRPRTRARHSESEGESESEDPTTVYRALRRDEEPSRGLKPRGKSEHSVGLAHHIRSGTRSRSTRNVSGWLSLTRSLKVAAAWAANNPEGTGRVAKVVLTKRVTDRPGAYYDLTDPGHFSQVFPKSRDRAGAFAKASQEVAVKNTIVPGEIREIFQVRKVGKTEYEQLRSTRPPRLYSLVTTRARSEDDPTPLAVERTGA